MDVRQYQTALEESMTRIDHAGAVGRQTICLKWRSAFADTYSGVTTYKFVALGDGRRIDFW
jgi:hypothetical protein